MDVNPSCAWFISKNLKNKLGEMMVATGTFVFNSAGECLKSAMRPTEYEQTHDIQCTGHEMILDDPEIKIAKIKKSDGSSTMVILFKKAKHKEIWINFIPTKHQFGVLMSLKETIQKIEEENKISRTK